MNHIFKKTFSLETALPQSDIVDRLFESDDYDADIFLDKFSLVRAADKEQHTYYPQIIGKMNNTDAGTQIDIQMQLTTLNAIALAVTYIGISILVIGGFRLFGLNDLIFVNIEWIWIPMILVGFVKQIVLKFGAECKNSKEHLKALLCAKEL